MSNLGAYQLMTTLAKKVGGPYGLAGIFITAGAALGVGATCGVKHITDKSKAKKKKSQKDSITYVINKDSSTNEGVKLEKGLKFRVLEKDGDAVLVELLGVDNNPYFVSAKLLKSVSNYC